MELIKSNNNIERYEAEIDGHKLHIYVEEDDKFFHYSLSVDNYGVIEYMFGAFKPEATKESFLEMIVRNIVEYKQYDHIGYLEEREREEEERWFFEE